MSKSTKWVVIVLLIMLAIDQVTKFLVCNQLTLSQSVSIIGNFIRITLVKNKYGLFGLRFNIPFIPLTSIAICVVGILLWRLKTTVLSIILGGAIGNLIDRVRLGAVIDWIDIGIGNLRWPTFNIADAGITVGIILLIVKGLKEKK